MKKAGLAPCLRREAASYFFASSFFGAAFFASVFFGAAFFGSAFFASAFFASAFFSCATALVATKAEALTAANTAANITDSSLLISISPSWYGPKRVGATACRHAPVCQQRGSPVAVDLVHLAVFLPVGSDPRARF